MHIYIIFYKISYTKILNYKINQALLIQKLTLNRGNSIEDKINLSIVIGASGFWSRVSQKRRLKKGWKVHQSALWCDSFEKIMTNLQLVAHGDPEEEILRSNNDKCANPGPMIKSTWAMSAAAAENPQLIWATTS